MKGHFYCFLKYFKDTKNETLLSDGVLPRSPPFEFLRSLAHSLSPHSPSHSFTHTLVTHGAARSVNSLTKTHEDSLTHADSPLALPLTHSLTHEDPRRRTQDSLNSQRLTQFTKTHSLTKTHLKGEDAQRLTHSRGLTQLTKPRSRRLSRRKTLSLTSARRLTHED